MKFYDEISKYYDYIFPAEEQQVSFISEAAGEPPMKILDIACGSGGYSVALAKAGYSMTATDLDEKMVEMARAKNQAEGLNIDAAVLNMLDIGLKFERNTFDMIFCIGNSIVHLGSKEDILCELKQIRHCLKPGGKAVIQIINFDRVFKYNISSLPTTVNEEIGLKFVRNYIYDKVKGLINFNTVLTVKGPEGREEHENTVELVPLLSDDMMELMKRAGFKDVAFYGDFKYSEYNTDSFMLVVKGTK